MKFKKFKKAIAIATLATTLTGCGFNNNINQNTNIEETSVSDEKKLQKYENRYGIIAYFDSEDEWYHSFHKTNEYKTFTKEEYNRLTNYADDGYIPIGENKKLFDELLDKLNEYNHTEYENDGFFGLSWDREKDDKFTGNTREMKYGLALKKGRYSLENVFVDDKSKLDENYYLFSKDLVSSFYGDTNKGENILYENIRKTPYGRAPYEAVSINITDLLGFDDNYLDRDNFVKYKKLTK